MRRTPSTFAITRVSIVAAGDQSTAVETSTASGRGRDQEFLSVTIEDLIVYCYDREVVQAFARAFATALEYAPADLPAARPAGPARHGAGVVLRMAGTPHRITTHGLGGAATPSGAAEIRVILAPLTVHLVDLLAATSWADTWQRALKAANRVWPDPDAFELAERAERLRIATTGKATPQHTSQPT